MPLLFLKLQVINKAHKACNCDECRDLSEGVLVR